MNEERFWVSDAKEKAKDKIISWESLIDYCKSFELNISSSDECIRLCKLSDDMFPPKVIFAVRIEKCYSVVAYRGPTLIPLTDILKNFFQYKLTTYSQLHGIIEKVEESTVNVQ